MTPNRAGTTAAHTEDLGARLVKDHTKSLAELKKVAATLHVTVPASAEPPMQWELKQTASLSGTAFDRAYTSLEVADHKQDIADNTEEATSGSDPSVKALAKKDLPILPLHLRLSQAAERRS